jgi:hypothetical protein
VADRPVFNTTARTDTRRAGPEPVTALCLRGVLTVDRHAGVDDWIVWLIILGFYAPLHYLMPALVLFITGREDEATRRRLIRRGLVDSTVSMVAAFVVVLLMVRSDLLFPAMFVLLLSMLYPFLGIWRRRAALSGETG